MATRFKLQASREITNDENENSHVIIPDCSDGLVKICESNKDKVRVVLAEFDPHEALLVAEALKLTAEEMIKNA